MAVSEIRRIELEEEAEKIAKKTERMNMFGLALVSLMGGFLICFGILFTITLIFAAIGIPLLIIGLIVIILCHLGKNSSEKARERKAKEIYRQLLKEEIQSSNTDAD